MKALDSKVNIIPVVAKADTITKGELHKFKIKVGRTVLYITITTSMAQERYHKYI